MADLISDFDYHKACTELIENALLRPGMFFHSLKDLETILWGHGHAFSQLEIIIQDTSFHFLFMKWIYQNTGQSTSCGWADAIESLASTKGRDPVEIFSELVREFLDQWEDHDDAPKENK